MKYLGTLVKSGVFTYVYQEDDGSIIEGQKPSRDTMIAAKQNQVGGDHYEKQGIQPIDYIEANELGFSEGNVIKYVTRYKDKNGLEDLKKAKWYIERIINNYKE